MGCTVDEGNWGVHFTGKYLGCTVDEGVIGVYTLLGSVWDVPFMKELLGYPVY